MTKSCITQSGVSKLNHINDTTPTLTNKQIVRMNKKIVVFKRTRKSHLNEQEKEKKLQKFI